jgi:hypothetical protein
MGGNGMVKGISAVTPWARNLTADSPFSLFACGCGNRLRRSAGLLALGQPAQPSVARRMLHSPISPLIRFWREWLSPILPELCSSSSSGTCCVCPLAARSTEPPNTKRHQASLQIVSGGGFSNLWSVCGVGETVERVWFCWLHI